MAQATSTVDLEYFRSGRGSEPVPGVLMIYQGGEPCYAVHPLVDGQLELGRGTPNGPALDDPTMSRRHARLTFAAGRFEIEDLGSRNGLVADGEHVGPSGRRGVERVLRIGETVLLVEDDLRAAQGSISRQDGVVVGPRLARAWQALDDIAASSDVVHIRGESGAGKELAARRFHDMASTPDARLVPVNCAAIPAGVAERLLFGARKGSFSGAHADAEGLVQAADGGTLFLDEIGELDLDVQAKLLRVVETRTVFAVGDVKPRAVDFRLVSATHRDLRQLVSERRFREDLFFRISRPEVVIPALRDRAEEIPWLMSSAIKEIDAALALAPALVEAALLRQWPGNIRELLLEARAAGRRAAVEGAGVVGVEHLDERAGRAHAESAEGSDDASGKRIDKSMLPERKAIEAALREHGGRVATTARALGVHRNQLRRWLDENNVDPRVFAVTD